MLNYRSPSHESELTRTVKEFNIRHAFDCVSEHGSFQRIAYSMSLNGPPLDLDAESEVEAEVEERGHITYLLPIPSDEQSLLPKSVRMTRTFVADAHAPAASAFAAKYCRLAGEWLEAGLLRPQKVTVVEGGLGGVKEGLRRLREGEVSGEKLVYRVAETEGLGGGE